MYETFDYVPGRVIEWRDEQGPSLAEQLRSRPGKWATVGERIPSLVLGIRLGELNLGDEFELDCSPVDDGPYGLLYDIEARFVGEQHETEEPPRRTM